MYYCENCKATFSVVIAGKEVDIGACPYCGHAGIIQSNLIPNGTITISQSHTRLEPVGIGEIVRDFMFEFVDHGPLVAEPKNREIRKRK